MNMDEVGDGEKTENRWSNVVMDLRLKLFKVHSGSWQKVQTQLD